MRLRRWCDECTPVTCDRSENRLPIIVYSLLPSKMEVMKNNSENFPASEMAILEMTLRSDWTERLAADVDPKAVLDDVVSGLQILCAETALFASPTNSMIDLHAALLMFELGGRRELLPSVGLGVTARWSLERRIVSSARVLAGRAEGPEAAYAVWKRAAARIEDLIALIDPELRILAAS